MATYYFDGHSGISDPNSVWTNEANAFDGSTTTSATASDNGSSLSHYLLGEGTNAPSTGLNPTSVRVRGWKSGLFVTCAANVYTDGQSEVLASFSFGHETYGPYTTLAVPTGGWTWPKIQELEIRIYFYQDPDGTGGDVINVELYVYTDPIPGRIYRIQGFQ